MAGVEFSQGSAPPMAINSSPHDSLSMPPPPHRFPHERPSQSLMHFEQIAKDKAAVNQSGRELTSTVMPTPCRLNPGKINHPCIQRSDESLG